MNAIIDAFVAHSTMSKQALDSEKVCSGLRGIYLKNLPYPLFFKEGNFFRSSGRARITTLISPNSAMIRVAIVWIISD